MPSLNKYELEKKLADFLEMVKRKLESDTERGFKVLYKQYTIKPYVNAIELEIELDITDENQIDNSEWVDYESIEYYCGEYARDKEFEECIENAIEIARENASNVIEYYVKTNSIGVSIEVKTGIYVHDNAYYESYIQYLKFKFKYIIFEDALEDLKKLENEIVKNVYKHFEIFYSL